MRELMRGYIEQLRQAREYDDYLQRKVEAGRASMRTGQGRSNDEVEAAFATQPGGERPGVIVVWMPEAEQDRADICNYMATDNPGAAVRPNWSELDTINPGLTA
jgi:plasmid stabilization system protein ParE